MYATAGNTTAYKRAWYAIDLLFYVSAYVSCKYVRHLLTYLLVAAPGISASPSESNLRYFNVMILGPQQSCFEGEANIHDFVRFQYCVDHIDSCVIRWSFQT